MSSHAAANKIMEVVNAYGNGLMDDDYAFMSDEDAVEQIIAILRDAMLGDKPRDAALSAIRGFAPEGEPIYVGRDDVWNGMYAAVVAAGLEDDDDD